MCCQCENHAILKVRKERNRIWSRRHFDDRGSSCFSLFVSASSSSSVSHGACGKNGYPADEIQTLVYEIWSTRGKFSVESISARMQDRSPNCFSFSVYLSLSFKLDKTNAAHAIKYTHIFQFYRYTHKDTHTRLLSPNKLDYLLPLNFTIALSYIDIYARAQMAKILE